MRPEFGRINSVRSESGFYHEGNSGFGFLAERCPPWYGENSVPPFSLTMRIPSRRQNSSEVSRGFLSSFLSSLIDSLAGASIPPTTPTISRKGSVARISSRSRIWFFAPKPESNRGRPTQLKRWMTIEGHVFFHRIPDRLQQGTAEDKELQNDTFYDAPGLQSRDGKSDSGHQPAR
jgi:hypothetical protein